MKKIFILIIIAFLAFLSACKQKDEKERLNVKNIKTETLASKNNVSNKKDAVVVDSFYDENGNWYYTIEIGAITKVPLQSMNNTGMIRWTQNSTSYTKTVTTTVTEASSMRSMLENQVTEAVSTEMDSKISIAISAEETANLSYFELGSASLKTTQSVAYENVWKNSLSYESQYSSSFEQASSKTTTDTISETIVFDDTCTTGYYGWNLCGNLKVYAFLVYNPVSAKYNISYLTDIVATYWSFDYLTDDEFNSLSLGYHYDNVLDFEIPPLEEPTTSLNVATLTQNSGKKYINVVLDGNGGYCNQSIIIYEGSKYGELPTPSYNSNFYLIGWEDPYGNIVDRDTICNYNEDHTLKAKWGKAVFTKAFDGFTLLERENTKLTLDVDINKDAMIRAGYTAYTIKVEFNARALGNTVDSEMRIHFYVSEYFLGATNVIDVPRTGMHLSKSYAYNGDGNFNTEYFVNGKNKVIIEFENYKGIDIIFNYRIQVSNLNATVTYYNPNN